MTRIGFESGRRVVALVAAVVVTMILLVGCTPGEQATRPTAVAIPETPVGQTVSWILDEFNADRDTTPAQWEARLHDTFLAEVSADELTDLINAQVRPARPLAPTAYRGSESDAVVTVAGRLGEPFDLTVVIDDAGLITGLWLGPVAEPREPAATLDEIRDRFAALPGDVRVLARDGDGTALLDIGADDPAPLGSVFKLYVLGAVVAAIEAGEQGWDDALVVTDDVRSLPSGELQNAPNGTEVTVREAAQKMIEISDNTATDLLIYAVGRDAVEAQVANMGHHDPAMLRPFLTTRELFALRWGGHDDLADLWLAGDEIERRLVLDDLAARPFELTAADLDTVPSWHDMEWFATATDVAAAQEWLHDQAVPHPELREVLGSNPGIEAPGAWAHLAFKGGSEPGVLAGSWLGERADGSTLTVVVLASSDREHEIEADAAELFGLVADLFALEG